MTRKFLMAIFTLILFFIASSSFAAFRTLTGGELLEACKAAIDTVDKNSGIIHKEDPYTQGIKAGTCEGFLMSMNEMNNLKTRELDFSKKVSKARQYYCLPENYNLLQAATFIVKYLNDHPQLQSKPASTLALNAYHNSFGCWS